ncbi:MAG: Glu/Leu/Phe/Val dehydrogenase [Bacillota bacterium]
MELYNYENLVFGQDRESGLKAIIAIHDTTLGPALGGTRMWAYTSEEEAVRDVLRLARGMTYKAAVAGLDLGGGKAVIIGDSRKEKSEKLLRAYGRFVDTLKGKYITAEDVGTCQQDMDLIRQETAHVVGVDPAQGGSGDPSPFTALGVFHGMKAAAKFVYGSESLAGKRVAVQGVGHVGYHLCHLLADEGAELVITDINQALVEEAVREFGALAVLPQDIFSVQCDIFAPCALGAVINDQTIPHLKCRIVAGAANNVLAEEYHGEHLIEKGILYVPDFVINAGGLINVAEELHGYQRQRAIDKVVRIYDSVTEVLQVSKKETIPPFQAANRLAEERIARRKSRWPLQGVSKVG